MWQTQCQFAKLLILEVPLLRCKLTAWLSSSLGNYPATCHTPTKWQFFRASFSLIVQASLRILLPRKFYIVVYQATNQQFVDTLRPRIKFWMPNFIGGCDSGWERHFRNQNTVSCLLSPNSGTVLGNSFSSLWCVSPVCSGLTPAYSFSHPSFAKHWTLIIWKLLFWMASCAELRFS